MGNLETWSVLSLQETPDDDDATQGDDVDGHLIAKSTFSVGC